MRVYDRIKRWGRWLLADACVLCGETLPGGRHFCAGCERALPRLTGGCPRCAAPVDVPVAAGAPLPCGRCQADPPPYTGVHSPFCYAAPIDRLVQGAKYGGRLDWLAILARRLALHVQERAPCVDLLVPVPLHRARLRERGYNQSLELARPLARRLGLPLTRGMARLRATPPQTHLSRDERHENTRRAFAVIEDVAGARIAVVDDVMTSGATADAVTRCLRAAGAASVEIWIVARA